MEIIQLYQNAYFVYPFGTKQSQHMLITSEGQHRTLLTTLQPQDWPADWWQISSVVVFMHIHTDSLVPKTRDAKCPPQCQLSNLTWRLTWHHFQFLLNPGLPVPVAARSKA